MHMCASHVHNGASRCPDWLPAGTSASRRSSLSRHGSGLSGVLTTEGSTAQIRSCNSVGKHGGIVEHSTDTAHMSTCPEIEAITEDTQQHGIPRLSRSVRGGLQYYAPGAAAPTSGPLMMPAVLNSHTPACSKAGGQGGQGGQAATPDGWRGSSGSSRTVLPWYVARPHRNNPVRRNVTWNTGRREPLRCSVLAPRSSIGEVDHCSQVPAAMPAPACRQSTPVDLEQVCQKLAQCAQASGVESDPPSCCDTLSGTHPDPKACDGAASAKRSQPPHSRRSVPAIRGGALAHHSANHTSTEHTAQSQPSCSSLLPSYRQMHGSALLLQALRTISSYEGPDDEVAECDPPLQGARHCQDVHPCVRAQLCRAGGAGDKYDPVEALLMPANVPMGVNAQSAA